VKRGERLALRRGALEQAEIAVGRVECAHREKGGAYPEMEGAA